MTTWYQYNITVLLVPDQHSPQFSNNHFSPKNVEKSTIKIQNRICVYQKGNSKLNRTINRLHTTPLTERLL